MLSVDRSKAFRTFRNIRKPNQNKTCAHFLHRETAHVEKNSFMSLRCTGSKSVGCKDYLAGVVNQQSASYSYSFDEVNHLAGSGGDVTF